MLELYIEVDGKKMRCGYTTGTCAALASKAAAIMLIKKVRLDKISIITPKGVEVETDIYDININDNYVSCAIKKDSGDDIDSTRGILIYSKVSKNNDGIIFIDGGIGIGRVTKAGIDQGVGMAAINSTPRKMIKDELNKIIEDNLIEHGFDVLIYAPEGEKIAESTFNKEIGIVGGISIIGTSGIVEPMSIDALKASIALEIRINSHDMKSFLIITPGNYGRYFAEKLGFNEPIVKCSNFVSTALNCALEEDVKDILLIGHIGKFVKLAGGLFDTHSKTGDCRLEIITAYASILGASNKVAVDLMDSATTESAADILKKEGILDDVFKKIGDKAMYLINRRFKGLNIRLIMFSNVHGILYESEE